MLPFTQKHSLLLLSMHRFFVENVTNWYEIHKRNLPWRKTRAPYKVWLSEIILQQTRVNQGLPYYKSFLQKFPSVLHLASADEQEVLTLWQGLGYYSRARNLHAAAKQVVDEFGSEFPSDYHLLKKLKGIGPYTAAAIASFCFDAPTPVLDGNVYRLFARFFGIHTPIQTPAAEKEFIKMGETLIAFSHPALFNQAIMEFGALQCKPKSPDCTSCVLHPNCYAYLNQVVNILPVKPIKKRVKVRQMHYLLLQHQNKWYVQKRTANDIWKHLYEFPLLEGYQKPTLAEWKKTATLKNFHVKNLKLLEEMPVVHKLTHRELQIHFWKADCDSPDDNFISLPQLQKLPFPVVLKKFIDNHLFQG